MERKLLLLGMIRVQEMHGYQINELIDTHLGTSIQLKRPTAYKLLGVMQHDGWITSREEQEGNYPTRRIYTITPEGDTAFQQLLRENLSDYKPISYMNDIGIIYLDALPAEESASLLSQRRAKVESFVENISENEGQHGSFQLILSYHLKHLNAELEWLDEVIGQLQPINS